ncbi:hypothetical protein MBAV_001100 [Candidatus Magnetobacterium bavaricum]|uniref:Uncharacterized protein n=1 Tax=Candidatus Magnetobacterium bavaricum TaxID=29290 RepID=A0A0F3GXX2_9BACT|nr:hypothetical protein MBAV_001100 [Candidatus Magnetobacterium bavaricum]
MFDLLDGVNAFHTRHHGIHKDYIKAVDTSLVDGLTCTGGIIGVITGRGQYLRQLKPDIGVIVYNKQLSHCSWAEGKTIVILVPLPGIL